MHVYYVLGCIFVFKLPGVKILHEFSLKKILTKVILLTSLHSLSTSLDMITELSDFLFYSALPLFIKPRLLTH